LTISSSIYSHHETSCNSEYCLSYAWRTGIYKIPFIINWFHDYDSYSPPLTRLNFILNLAVITPLQTFWPDVSS